MRANTDQVNKLDIFYNTMVGLLAIDMTHNVNMRCPRILWIFWHETWSKFTEYEKSTLVFSIIGLNFDKCQNYVILSKLLMPLSFNFCFIKHEHHKAKSNKKKK